ncbi:hypothetical protein UlMin_008573 [Ulmus minor]
MTSPLLVAILLAIIGSLYTFLIPLATRSHRKNGRKLPPGPRRLPIIGNLHMLTPLPHRGLRNLAKKYGPIMSLQLGHVPTIIVSSPRAAELFLKTHDAVFASRPKGQSSKYLNYDTKGFAFAQFGPYWRSVRKLCTEQLLSGSKVESFCELRTEEVGLLVERLKRAAAAREAVDVGLEVAEAIEDITYRMILGRKKDEKDDLKELIDEALHLAGAFNISDYVPFLGPLDLQGISKRLKKTSKAIDQVLEKIIMEHEKVSNEQRGQIHKDFVDILLSLIGQPMNPKDDEVYIIDRTNIKAILLDMVVGSYDTSSTSVSWTLSELLRNPRTMKNLQKELENVIGLDEMVNEKNLTKLNYLDIVIKESFRLHPAAPLLVPHESMEDIIIEDFFVPKNSRIIVNTWAIGRDPNIWSDNVDEFYPERFIDNNIDQLKGHDYRLLPFGSGRRGCPGIQLGLVTVRIVVAQLVHCFNWELPSGVQPKDVDMTESFGLAVGRANQMLVKPTYRLLQ